VAEAMVVALALVFTGGIYLASYLPDRPSLAPAVGLLVAAAALVVASGAALARTSGFAWRPFFRVSGWTLLAYAVIAGLLEYVFVRNGTRGSSLVVMTLMLAVFAAAVALLIGFSVARHEPAGDGASAR
jgi:hypothetical protein